MADALSRLWRIIVSFRRLGTLGPRQWVMLPQLVVLASMITVGLRIARFATVVDAVSRASRSSYLRWLPAFQNRCSIGDLVAVTGIASRVSFRNRCLVRSLMLFWLMCARDEPAEIVLGVSKRGAEFRAHAWTLNHSGLLGEDPRTLEQFAVLAKFGNGLEL